MRHYYTEAEERFLTYCLIGVIVPLLIPFLIVLLPFWALGRFIVWVSGAEPPEKVAK